MPHAIAGEYIPGAHFRVHVLLPDWLRSLKPGLLLKLSDSTTHLNDLSGRVLTQDVGVVQRTQCQVLQLPVNELILIATPESLITISFASGVG
jgi:hypothetical protein